MDPTVWREIERLLVALGGILSIYLGYRLFIYGIEKGRDRLSVHISEKMRIIFSGQGPGLFFMAFGSVLLLVALFTGGASSSGKKLDKSITPDSLTYKEYEFDNERLHPAPNRGHCYKDSSGFFLVFNDYKDLIGIIPKNTSALYRAMESADVKSDIEILLDYENRIVRIEVWGPGNRKSGKVFKEPPYMKIKK